jgi:L-ascorbate metabolism protein UlaG (beta-lactamase superfamily)
MSRKNDMKLKWLGHSSFKITIGNEAFYFDPIRKNKLLGTTLDPKKENNVTAIFISHEHWDHCDDTTVRQLGSMETRIIGPEKALSNLFFPSMSYEFDSFQEKDIHTSCQAR